MKKSIFEVFIALLLVLFLFSCSKENNSTDQFKGTLNLQFEITGNLKSTSNLNCLENEISAIYVTIMDSELEYVYNLYKLPLLRMGDNFITEAITLKTGSYTIEDFIVVNDADSILYLTPKTGSEFESLVDNPLPLAFDVTHNDTTCLILEVIPSNLGDPLDYGYSIFSFTIVNTLEKGLVAYYPFNGNSNDESGNSYDLINYGAELTTDRNGNCESAYSFMGNSGLILSNQILHNQSEAQSISLWFKTDNLNSVSYGGILFGILGSLPPGSGSRFVISIKDGVIRGSYGDEYGDDESWAHTLSSDAIIFSNNSWHHIVLVSNGDNSTISLYADAVLIGTLDLAKSNNNVSGSLDIKCGGDKPENYYVGVIDDIRLYNRAITQQEIFELYTIN